MHRTFSRTVIRACQRQYSIHRQFQTLAEPFAGVAAQSESITSFETIENPDFDLQSYSEPLIESGESTEREVKMLKGRFEFEPANLKLRTWLPDEIYSILEQYPNTIPASLAGLRSEDPSVKRIQLSILPDNEAEREAFLEDEAVNRPRQLLYRFYACGGFWLCTDEHVAHFLKGFSSSSMCGLVPFIRQVMKMRVEHRVPEFQVKPGRVVMPHPGPLERTMNNPYVMRHIYNEQFRALASQGRDDELLSLWDEAKSLGVFFDYYSYRMLFRCLQKSPTPRIKEAIYAFYECRKTTVGSGYQKAILAQELLNLILQRVHPSALDEETTFDRLVNVAFGLSWWIATAAGGGNTTELADSRLNGDNETHTLTQRQIITYFRLCGRLRQASRLSQFYMNCRSQGVRFTRSMYSFALAGASHALPGYANQVLRDMANDGYEVDAQNARPLLREAYCRGDIASALRHFYTLESSNCVDGDLIRMIIRCYKVNSFVAQQLYRQGFLEWKVRSNYIEGQTGKRVVTLLRREVNRLYDEYQVRDRIVNGTRIPFLVGPTKFTESVLQCVSLVCYLVRRYPKFFCEPESFNAYLSYAVRWRFTSVEAIFRDCYAHFPLSEEKLQKLEAARRVDRRTQNPISADRWHWPLPRLSREEGQALPAHLPRPDKYTFTLAMEYAFYRRLPAFAQEVWARREAWLAEIKKEARKDLNDSRWSQVSEKDLLRYEHRLVDTITSDQQWAKRATELSEMSDGASDTLYEGYKRILYIQVLAAHGYCDEAFTVMLEGTGERYQWTQSMLAKVKRYAEMYGHKEMYNYISNLADDVTSVQKPSNYWF